MTVSRWFCRDAYFTRSLTCWRRFMTRKFNRWSRYWQVRYLYNYDHALEQLIYGQPIDKVKASRRRSTCETVKMNYFYPLPNRDNLRFLIFLFSCKLNFNGTTSSVNCFFSNLVTTKCIVFQLKQSYNFLNNKRIK